MLFHSTVLLTLLTSTFALPAPAPEAHLVARAKIPASVNCEGQTFTVCHHSQPHLPLHKSNKNQADVIKQTIANSKTSRRASNDKYYPDYFGNKSGNTKVFGNIPDTSNLYGQPLSNPVWTGKCSFPFLFHL
jgi:hypothetical protein